MNRFKVTIAKEKILRLREKYSKNINQDEAKSSSESIISMKSERSADHENLFRQQTTVSEKPVLPYTDDKAPRPTVSVKEDLFKEGIMKEDVLKADFELYDNIVEESKESKFDVAEQSFEKPLSSGSVVLSDLSSQFEHIRFISSSSEDLSIVESENTLSIVESENTLSIVESKNTQTNSISANLSSSVKVPERNKRSSNVEIEFPKVVENCKTLNPTERNSSLKSLSKSESNDSTKISSIRELLINSESEARKTSHDTSFSELSEDSNDHIKFGEKVDSMNCPPQNNEIGELGSNISFTSILEKKTSVNAAGSKVRKISTDTGSNISKIYKYNNNQNKVKGKNEGKYVSLDSISVTKTSSKALNLQSVTDMHIEYNDLVNQSTNTDPVKVTLLKNRSKHHQRKPVACINSDRPTGKMEKYKPFKLSKKQDFSIKQPRPNKRPFIKPCNLINQDEIRNIESKGAIHQEIQSLKYNLADDFYNYPTSVATSEISCDEVITLLLRNQIQLTRHFIESHQRMYLQVCQAAQLLNENHSSR